MNDSKNENATSLVASLSSSFSMFDKATSDWFFPSSVSFPGRIRDSKTIDTWRAEREEKMY